MPLRPRRWFQVTIAIASLLIAYVCWRIVDTCLPSNAPTAHFCLLLLMQTSTIGFYRLLSMSIAVLLLKLGPRLERE